jgi:hypothetical protein
MQVFPEKGGMIDFCGMVQLKSVCGFHSRLKDPFLNTILDWQRRFPIGKNDIMPSLLQSLTEVHGWIGRTCPLPIAKKMEDFHCS